MTQIASTAVFALALGLVTQAVTYDPPTAGSQNTILITTLVGFASLLVTQLFALWRESRNRRWDLDDREAARREAKHHAEAQRVETVQTAIELAKVSQANRDQLLRHLEHNTQITREAKESAEAAFAVANNFNEKMETLRRQLASKSQTIDHIDEVSLDTNVKVTKLEHDGEHPTRRGR